MVECYGASLTQTGHTANEDAFVIGRDPVPYAAVFDGTGMAERSAQVAARNFKLQIKDQQEKVADPLAWANWVKLMDSHLMGLAQSAFVGVAVTNEATSSVVGAWAGDSRAYVFGEKGTNLLTPSTSPRRLGSGLCKPGTFALKLDNYDILLLMSDGAWTPLGSPYLMRKTVMGAVGKHFSDLPQAILDAAQRTGRWDDMTVVALRCRG
jgi:serine/threonine protein phosphatase PrpC